MADKDYKVQVGVEAKADTRGLDQVNKGLDKVRKTAHQVNEELGDEEVATNLEDVTEAAEETAEALDKTSDAAEGVQDAVSQVGQTARATGDEMNKAGSKGEAAGRKMERGANRAASGLGNLKSKVQATFNIPNELEAAYNRGVAWGKAILDAWDKYIEGVDKAAVKRARELKDRLATEAAAREQAYTDALTNAKRERIYDEEQRRITAINDLYTQRLQLIGQLAVNRTAEVDHVEALRQKELELQRTIVNTREIRGEITKETAAALMADLDDSEARSAAKRLQSLSMRINGDDAAGQRVVSLVKELVQGELGRILMTMSRPQPVKPRRVTPEGRDLDAEEAERARIRAGAQAPQPPPHPAPQPAAGQDYSSMIGEFSRQMFGQGDTSGRILDVMQQFISIAKQAADKSSRHNDRLSTIEREVAALKSREQYGRH